MPTSTQLTCINFIFIWLFLSYRCCIKENNSSNPKVICKQGPNYLVLKEARANKENNKAKCKGQSKPQNYK